MLEHSLHSCRLSSQSDHGTRRVGLDGHEVRWSRAPDNDGMVDASDATGVKRPRCDEVPAWSALWDHFEHAGRALDLREAFGRDPGRFAAFSQDAPRIFADLSKNLIDSRTEALLMQLARECELERHRDAMFAGEAINNTEHRTVKHWLLRVPKGASKDPDAAAVHATLDAMLAFAERVRADSVITDVVNIGIGGSDLGPQMAVTALEAFVLPGKRFHFVSNVDGHELAGVLRRLRPDSTLFLIASKTFTTIETMTNARSARAWFAAEGGYDVARHFVALTTNVEAAREFGISTTFGFWDWVGGRYSMWSAIGLPIAIAIGAEGFRQLLAGAHEMDQHFATAPLERNLPVRLGLLDVWNCNFYGFASRSIAPYHSALRRLPAYLQQLEMESNGKRVDARGRALACSSAPVLWGEPGTNGQHAYFQMLHQGTNVVPVEFVAVKTPMHDLPAHHELLLANVLAQAQALLQGKRDPSGHRDFPGNRPSSFFLLDRLDPSSLGALIALQEHRVFASGSLYGINSFDQWGVELGKGLALDIAARLSSGNASGLDSSTAGLLRRLV
jgi:glucose-6-phosphate isomerase